MKKITAFILALAMLASLTACGGNDNPAPQNTPANNAPAVGNDTPSNEDNGGDNAGNDNGGNGDSDNHTALIKPETNYRPGIVTEDGFESEYLSFRFSHPDFNIATRADLNKSMKLDPELTDLDELAAKMANMKLTQEMGAGMDMTAGELTHVMVRTERGSQGGMTVDEYVELTMTRYITGSVEQVGGLTLVEMAGHMYTRLDVDAKGFMFTYLLRELDDRVLVIVIGYEADKPEELDRALQGFSAY